LVQTYTDTLFYQLPPTLTEPYLKFPSLQLSCSKSISQSLQEIEVAKVAVGQGVVPAVPRTGQLVALERVVRSCTRLESKPLWSSPLFHFALR
jgi:hypothetical protein